MLASQARRLGESLVDRHVLSRDALEDALAEADERQQPLPAVLLQRGLVGTKDLTAALAEQLGLRFVDFLETPIHQDAPLLIAPELARKHLALPVDIEGTHLVVAFAEPADDEAVAAIGAATGYEIVPAVADRAELARAIDMIYGAGVQGAAPAESPAIHDAPVEVRADDVHINDLLELVIEYRASDLHLTATSPPVIRVNGELLPLTHLPVLNGSQIRQMVYSILSQKQREKFEQDLELDTSYSIPGKGRFRVNVFVQRDSVGCVMRAIPYQIVAFDDLGIPPAVKTWAYLPRGLVLVTGPTGSGSRQRSRASLTS